MERSQHRKPGESDRNHPRLSIAEEQPSPFVPLTKGDGTERCPIAFWSNEPFSFSFYPEACEGEESFTAALFSLFTPTRTRFFVAQAGWSLTDQQQCLFHWFTQPFHQFSHLVTYHVGVASQEAAR